MRSATPQLSKKVLSLTDENMSLEKARISLKPILIIAAWYSLQSKVKKRLTYNQYLSVQVLGLYLCVVSHVQSIYQTWVVFIFCFCQFHSKESKSEREVKPQEYKPAAMATTFFNVPHSSTPSTSCTWPHSQKKKIK